MNRATLAELEVMLDQLPSDTLKEHFNALIQRCAKSEAILRRIGSARLAFSLDSGGPESPLEGWYVIEGWISRHLNEDSYYGDIRYEITEALR